MDWEKDPSASELNAKLFLRGMGTVYRLSASQHPRLKIGFMCELIAMGFDLSFTFLVKLTFDALPAATQTGNFTDFAHCLLGLILVSATSLGIKNLIGHNTFIIGVIRLENDWPRMSQEKLLSLPASYHEQHNMGKNVSKVIKGCDRSVDALVSAFFSLFPAIIFWGLNLLILAVIDWRLALVLASPIPFALYLNSRMFQIALPLWESWEELKEQATNQLIQSVMNVPTVQAFVQEDREISEQSKIREKMNEIDVRCVKSERPYYAGMGILLQLGYIATFGTGAWFAWKGSVTLGTLTFIVATGLVTNQKFWDLIQVYRRLLRDIVSINRLEKLLREENDLPRNPNGILPTQTTGHLRFENVGYAYPNKEAKVFQGINLDIPAGSMVAFVGKTGSGKTTAVRLILRVADVTEGCITLDGKDIRAYNRDAYRRMFAYVKQDIDVFSTSIRKNIAYAHPEASEEEIIQAVRAAHLGIVLDDRERFPQGLDTKVGERGVKLSGGERQRLGIARAYLHLLQGAHFLVLDEATSSLDSEAEHAIREMVEELRRTRNITVIAIAHRLSTIKTADQIFVFHQGKIQERGNHHELIEAGGLYAKLVRFQALPDKPVLPSLSMQASA